MIDRLPAGQRRLLAISVLVVLLLLVLATAWLPLAYLNRQSAEIASAQRRIDELRARIPVREELLARERDLAQSGTTSEALLTGVTPAVAAAQLQGDISSLAAAMGGEIVSIQILEAEETPPFARIGLRVTMTGDTATMRDFLYAVETRNPVLIVRGMTLGSASPELADADADPRLNASLEIFGYAPRTILR